MNKHILFHEKLLGAIGIFYPQGKSYIAVSRYIVIIVTLMTYYVCGLVFLYNVADEFSNFAESLSILLVGFMGFFKFGTLIYSRHRMQGLREYIHQGAVRFGYTLTSDDDSIMEEYDKTGSKYGRTYTYLIFITTQGMVLHTLPGIYLGYGYHLPFPIETPYSMNTTTTFTITFIYSAICTNIFVLLYASFDSWFIFLVYHACGHFCVIQNFLEKISERDNRGNNRKMNESIAKCVQLHQNVYKFSADVEDAFCVCNLAQFLISSVAICTSGYQAVTLGFRKPQLFVKHLSSIFEQTVLSLLYNWCGELVREKSAAVSLAIAKSKSYELHVNQQKDLKFIMLRAQTPTCMTAGKFFELSLANFTNFLKTSMSYFTMLTSVQDVGDAELVF